MEATDAARAAMARGRHTVVCGIDPGLGTTGYAVVRATGDAVSVIDAGVCRFDEKQPLHRRLLGVYHDLSTIFAEHRPDFVAVEALYSHYRHPRTAILMGHARGVILLAAARANSEVRSYSATQVKRYLTGNGRATKAQMQRAIQTTLGLASLPEPPDLADALAIGLCCLADVRKAERAEVMS
jgi:crossover junction endodeoxyribonuclease RuvC